MRSVIITIAAAIAVGVAVFWVQSGPGEPASRPDSAAARPADPPPASSGPAVQAAARSADPAAPPTSYYEQFLAANDLWAFAAGMHRMALEGDDAAQYWLFRALERCGFLYDRAFGVEPGAAQRSGLSVDEAVQREMAKPWIGALEINRLHEQCARLRTPEARKFGTARDWLGRAADSGYPLAQVWMARLLLEDPQGGGGAGARAGAKARELMLAALRSGDPDVIRQSESVALLLVHGESARERHQWVWTIAGCMRGASCGPNADWVRALCAQDKHCQPHEGGLDIVRRQTGAQYTELQELAQELGQKIDAQSWSELGL